MSAPDDKISEIGGWREPVHSALEQAALMHVHETGAPLRYGPYDYEHPTREGVLQALSVVINKVTTGSRWDLNPSFTGDSGKMIIGDALRGLSALTSGGGVSITAETASAVEKYLRRG